MGDKPLEGSFNGNLEKGVDGPDVDLEGGLVLGKL